MSVENYSKYSIRNIQTTERNNHDNRVINK